MPSTCPTAVRAVSARGALLPATVALTTLCFSFLALPTSVRGQVRRGRPVQTAPRWAAPSIGVHIGLDQEAQGNVLGAHVGIPILRSGRVELMPAASAIFPIGDREYQYDLDVAFIPGGVRGGVLIGTGVAWRDSFAGTVPGEPRKRYFGYNAMVGGRARFGRLRVEVAVRWTFLNNTAFQPNTAALGLSFPFWRSLPDPDGS